VDGSAQGGLGLKFGAASALSRAVEALVQKSSSSEGDLLKMPSAVKNLAKEGLRRRKGAEASASEGGAPANGRVVGSAAGDGSKPREERQELRELPLKYEILRQVMVVVIFIILHQLSQRYVFNSWRGDDPSQLQATALHNSIKDGICPPGVEGCSHSVDMNGGTGSGHEYRHAPPTRL